MTLLKLRINDVEHCCAHQSEREPSHDSTFCAGIKEFISASEGCEYEGNIKGKANSYQLTSNLDDRLIHSIGWVSSQLKPDKELGQLPGIKPDGLFDYGTSRILLEVEKTNKKTIWFDLIKMIMLIRSHAAEYGLLVVPRNYCHSLGAWDLYKEAKFYRYCLSHFAGVSDDWLSKIAVVGYTQQVDANGSWMELDVKRLKSIKDSAKETFA